MGDSTSEGHVLQGDWLSKLTRLFNNVQILSTIVGEFMLLHDEHRQPKIASYLSNLWLVPFRIKIMTEFQVLSQAIPPCWEVLKWVPKGTDLPQIMDTEHDESRPSDDGPRRDH